ncbi:unnamed protein product [Mytilus edulis]|uniref:Uncharacterized protein n=1 Tax=Mytilus edulis TaxID=6550 RepID=A0A8S3QZA8_MYTED|nr:unnamed protein product [Mytilus edulis]
MIADLDRCFKPELPHAFPIAYGLKGYSMKTEAMSKMIHDVLYTLYLKGLYTPVVSYDGQWAKLSFQSSSGDPLTILELQKKVFNNVKQRDASTLTKDIFQRCIVKAESFEDMIQKISYVKEKHDILSNGSSVVYSSVSVGTKNGDQIRVSSNLVSIIKTFKSISNEQGNSKLDEVQSEDNVVDNILATIPSGVMSVLDDEVVTSLNTLQLESSKGQNNCDVMNSAIDKESFSVFDKAFGVNEEEHRETEPVTNTKESDNEIRTQSLEHMKPSQETFINMETAESEQTIIGSDDAHKIFEALQNKSKTSNKWLKYTFLEFKELTTDKDNLTKTMTKLELVLCLDVYNESTLDSKLHFCKSWNKSKLSDLLHEAFTSANISFAPKKKRNGFRNPVSLVNNCKKVIKTFPKKIMNIIISEHEFSDELNVWRENSPFTSTTTVDSVGTIVWFSQPEYNYSTLSYIFSFLDVHHLITNCRIKVCKDGFPERGVLRSAWVDVARENTTNLKVSHVEDLIDKQSDAIAKETFSLKVEATMNRLGHTKEAAFCRLIREFYEAEDDPGITASERCYRRINLRDWLLKGVNLCSFPPYGSHIRGIPNIMFQGFLTNIDRRIQLFPYVKSNMYNVRTLGSLEIENFFGEFQDLDPKGSGVIKAEEVPDALESASQLLSTRLMPNRPFHMSLSRAKVYPVKDLMAQCGTETIMPFVYPTLTNCIKLRDHMFDLKDRSKRKAQRKLATISEPDCAARGVAPVRQFHKVDESKILPHKRLGLLFEN